MLSSGRQGPSGDAEQGWSRGHREEGSPKRVKVKQTEIVPSQDDLRKGELCLSLKARFLAARRL